jgi:hypothetical protein
LKGLKNRPGRYFSKHWRNGYAKADVIMLIKIWITHLILFPPRNIVVVLHVGALFGAFVDRE